jgi:hypothetical protein
VGTGSITDVINDSSRLQVSLVGTQTTSAFDGNPLCSMYAVVDKTTLTGPLSVVCVGGPGSIFVSSGTFSTVACTSAMAEPTGPAGGDAR